MADKTANASLSKKEKNSKESSGSVSKGLSNVKNTTTFSQTTENTEVFFNYVRETIEQIEDELKSTERSEALRLIRKLKSQIDILESRLNSLPNNIGLFSNLDDIVLSARLNFQPELRARIQRLRKELEELKKKSSRLKARTSSRNNMLINNALTPSVFPILDALIEEGPQKNKEPHQEASDEVDALFEEKERTHKAKKEFSENSIAVDEFKNQEGPKDQNINIGIIDTLSEIESTLNKIERLCEIKEKKLSNTSPSDEFKDQEKARGQTIDKDAIGILDDIESTFREIERLLEINEKIQPDSAALASELESKKDPTERVTIESAKERKETIPSISNLVKAERTKEQLGQSL